MKQQECEGTQSVRRAFAVLEALAMIPGGMGVTELARRLDMNKSTAHRLLGALASMGYAERVPDEARYRLGLKVVELSSCG
jgi:DNA-binding IclR family transcriptional regulator